MDHDGSAEACLRANIRALMQQRRMKQEDLAERLQLSQAWVSKRLSGKPPPLGSRFQVADLNKLAEVFGVPPFTLLQPTIEWDRRRHGHDRRSGQDRRQRDR